MDDDRLADVIPHPSARPGIRDRNELQDRLEELPVRTKRDSLDTCRHRRGSFVDEAARKVVCRTCEVDLDPIHVLAQLAHAREQEILRARSLRLEADALQVQVAKLQREERNAKARIRRARSVRDDRDALIAAARVQLPGYVHGVRLGGYRPFDECSEAQQEVVLQIARAVVEGYHGALEIPPADEAVA